MIIVKLMGGLGNQMFQYAAGLSLATRLKTSLRLDITGYEDMHPDDTPRNYELDCFPIRATLASKQDLSRVVEAGQQASLRQRISRQVSKNGPLFTFGEPDKQDHDSFFKLRDNTYLVGWWQNEVYFKSIKDQLTQDFTPLRTGKIYSKYERAIRTAKQPIALHVRRGDYVTNSSANKHHGLASPKYYDDAIKHMESLVKDPEFFVFSDDIAWCKEHIKTKNITYAENTTSGYEDMRLMSLCKHNIIANSSFSWWAAWLNNNPEKIVVAPAVWFKNTESNNKTAIVPSEWKRL